MVKPIREQLYDSAAVKVMRSYDYCHFEISLGAVVPQEQMCIEGSGITKQDVDDMRKYAATLADKAVKQYKKAKIYYDLQTQTQSGLNKLREEVILIKLTFPESEWTAKHKAAVKSLADNEFIMSRGYDYWEDDEDEC